MFTKKFFRLYDCQKEIAQSNVKNGLFSSILNKELQYDTRLLLDDMFYMISTDRVVDPDTLKHHLRYQKTDPGLVELKDNIDKIIDIAEQVIQYEPNVV